MRKLLRRLFFWTHQQQFADDLAEEMEFHRAMRQEQLRQSGLSPKDADAATHRVLGNTTISREDSRGIWIWPCLDQLLQDTRHAYRLLIRNPFFAVTSIVLVAAAIGLVCAAFAVLDGAVLRDLPVPHPEQLVLVSGVGERGREAPTSAVFDLLKQERTYIQQIFGFRGTRLQGTVDGVTQDFSIFGVTGDYFGAQGAVPQLGRFFAPYESQDVAVISDSFWRRAFGADPNVIRRNLTLGLMKVSVIGVARSDFLGMMPGTLDVVLPLEVFHRALGLPVPVEVVARLRPGVAAKEYEAQLNTLWPSILQSTIPPGQTLNDWRAKMGARVRVDSVRHGVNYVFEVQPGIPRAIKMTFWLSVLIFSGSCLTLALLAVALAFKDQRQTAIRMAIGGNRWRVLRPYVLEYLIISAMGCAGGLLIALWWSALGASFLPSSVPEDLRINIDGNVIGLASFMALIVTATGTSVAWWLGCRAPLSRILQTGNPISQAHVRLRLCLLTLQLAMSVLLVHYALLYVGELSQLSEVPLGFDPANLHFFSLNGRLPKHNLDNSYFLELLEQIRRLPGVESAALTGTAPPLAYLRDISASVHTDDHREARAMGVCVFPGYFSTLKLPVVSGRDFAWNDQASVIVTSTLAKRLYANANPLTHTITLGRIKEPLQIVGVVGDTPYNGPRLGASATAFIPCLAEVKPFPSNYVVYIAARSKRTLAELAQDVRAQVDRLGVHYVYYMADQKDYLSGSLKQERMLASVSGMFGGLIVLLAGIGLYAFCNYLLVLRAKELAIRSSLGAGPVPIAAALLRETIKALVLGSIVGIALTFAGQRIFSSLIVRVDPPSIRHVVFALLVITGITLSAVLVPTFRALRINVVDALRVE